MLPALDFFDGRWRKQPLRQDVFARSRSGGAQQFVKRAFSEQIEIAGIGVTGIEEIRARFAGSHPAISKPCKAASVK